jgi:hypothetical protein
MGVNSGLKVRGPGESIRRVRWGLSPNVAGQASSAALSRPFGMEDRSFLVYSCFGAR